MATVGSSVAVWVFMMISICKISAQCGNTAKDIQAVDTRIAACVYPITALGTHQFSEITRQLNKMCSNLECRLSCIDRAIGNCDTTHDFYVDFDKQTFRASYRGLCADTTAANNALTGCADAVAAAMSVCSEYVTKWKMEQYLKSGNGALYKQTVCSGIASQATCVNVSPTESCTTTYADFVNTFLKTSLTYGTCGHPTTNQWFQDYSGPVNITGLTCGVSGVAPRTMFLAAMACFVALIKYMHT